MRIALMGLASFVLLCCAQTRKDDAMPRVVDPGPPPSDAVVLFDGKDVSHWTRDDGHTATGCKAQDGAMVCTTGDGNAVSKEKFRDAQVHIEFAVPNMADRQGQERGNSGVYLQGRYEIQVLDSYKSDTYPNGMCGALYGQAVPLVNPCRPPEQWQSYDIVFHAPVCGADGQVRRRGTVTVLHNGVLTLDHVTIENTFNGCGTDKLDQPGPLLLQDHNGPGSPRTVMKFRNIWFRVLPKPESGGNQ